ncbi:MAG: nucleotide sugar dehydrogenase [Omnitrophica WOR_2 bacterium]
MTLVELKNKIEQKEARLAIIGLGYVGLPVACVFAEAGFDVLGIELRSDRVHQINLGISPMEGEEPGIADLLSRVVASGKFRAGTDYRELRDRDVILIAVETPVDQHNIPRYQALKSSLCALSLELKPGMLVIVESTIAPGTMKEVIQPLLEGDSGLKANQDFYLGNCPERVMPGKLLKNIRSVSRVVGGMTPETAQTIKALYEHVVKADLDTTDCVTAELVKTAENAYRDVQIAFANEVALICEAAGGNVWKVRELVNKSPGRQMLMPGAGVGGHCIPKDPWLLAYGAKEKDVPVRLIPAARAVNDWMPHHMVQLVEQALLTTGRELNGSRVLLMGYSYLENSDDTRNSPSEAVAGQLRQAGAEVRIHDPFVNDFKSDVMELSQGCHAAVVMVRHNEYMHLDLPELGSRMQIPILVDGRRLYKEEVVRQAGFIYYGVGIGTGEK